MVEKTYVKFTEINQWEGEIWHFFIPIEGNEAAIVELLSYINQQECKMCYHLEMDRSYTEGEVDTIIKNTRTGYMPYNNKLSGRLKNVYDEAPVPGTDILYKGDIKRLMVDD